MIPELKPLELYIVALRKESVDRNQCSHGAAPLHEVSLSARRAWIEIRLRISAQAGLFCRSPQGERG